jgi:four helix bundle protein
MSEEPQEIGERAFNFAVRVVNLCQSLEGKKGVSRTLANQLLRSGTSVGANLEESKGGQSRADYLSKVSIALKEARETRYWLRLHVATDIIPENQLAPLLDESNQIVAILTTIVKKLKSDSISHFSFLTSHFPNDRYQPKTTGQHPLEHR